MRVGFEDKARIIRNSWQDENGVQRKGDGSFRQKCVDRACIVTGRGKLMRAERPTRYA